MWAAKPIRIYKLGPLWSLKKLLSILKSLLKIALQMYFGNSGMSNDETFGAAGQASFTLLIPLTLILLRKVINIIYDYIMVIEHITFFNTKI